MEKEMSEVVLEKFPLKIRALMREIMTKPDYDEKQAEYRRCWELMSTIPPLKIKSYKEPVHPCTVCQHADECWKILEIEKAIAVTVKEEHPELYITFS